MNNEIEYTQPIKNAVCYIDFMDCKNSFKTTRKDFKSYKNAENWMLETMEKFNSDFINYY